MRLTFLFTCLLCGFVALGCAPRGAFVFFSDVPDGSKMRSVLVASDRSQESLTGDGFGANRNDSLRLVLADVHVPPGRALGALPVSSDPKPDRDFGILDRTPAPTDSQIAAHVAGPDSVFLFVHGFNNTAAESIYRAAQVAEDFDVPGPAVVFSWSSAGDPRGYIYDRDSTVFARDGLERLLDMLVHDHGKQVFILAHSMGSQLVVETLRQMSIGRKPATLSQIEGVALLAPDIDPEVFRRLLSRIDPVPDPFIVMISRDDQALTLSGFLTGNRNRLGAITDPDAVKDLPISVIDITAFNDGASGHMKALTSPTLIRIIRQFQGRDPDVPQGTITILPPDF